MSTSLYSASRSAAPRVSLAGMRVLLIEDSWIIAQSYAALLEPVGVEVVGPAGSLQEATRLATEQQADAAMVDMDLRGELATGVIDVLHARGVPVIVVTGFEQLPEFGDKVRLVLKKPIRAERLLKALRSIAPEAKA